jgi:geranylgeranyl diphosphate synthase, type II
MDAEARLKTFADLVDIRLAELLPSDQIQPQRLHEAMRYSCLAPGKRLRPGLCMATAETCGQQPAQVLHAACALEMVHTFSLIHDDLPAIDDDDLRRGRPTCHKAFGEAIAVLAGDALFALAYEVLADSPHDAGPVVRCLSILSKAAGSDGLVGGEVVDVESEGKPVEEATLEFIHSRKTGRLIAASCEIGAILSGADEDVVQKLRLFGEEVGLAFQIADDLLNEESTPEALGKAAGTDRVRMKATYPALYGLGAARKKATERVDQAVAHLDGISGTELLIGLANFAADRLS